MLMVPVLMHVYGMTRPQAWFHSSTTVALIWFPLWVVLGLLLSRWATDRAA